MISLNIHFGTETSVDGQILKLMDTCFEEEEVYLLFGISGRFEENE